MKPEYTTQAEVRMSFWENIKGLNRSKELKFKRQNGDFRTDTRCAFVDYIDALERDGRISEKLAFKATLV